MPLDIARLGRRTFISQNAVSEILTAVRNSGEIPEHTSRATVKRRREAAIGIDTQYGQLLQQLAVQKEDGTTLLLDYCNPAAFLHYTSRHCPRMQDMLNAAAAQHLNSVTSKWQLMLYMDEVSPGNQLKVHNSRKLQAIYWSIQEFGGYNLTQEHAWCVLMCIRTDIVNSLAGGMAQVFKVVMKQFFQATCHFGFGINVQVNGENRMLCFEIGYVLADESALKYALDCKGASGKMLCFCCQTTIQARWAPARLGPLVLHTEHNSSKFVLHTDRSVWQIADHLHTASTMGWTKKKFKDEEMRLGWNYSPHGALLDPTCRQHYLPISHTCFDPMHVFLVAGVWHKEINLLLTCLHANGIRQTAVHDFCKTFTWPKMHGGAKGVARNVFKKKRESDEDFKCSSSEALAIYPVVRLFLQTMVPPPISDELRLAMNSYYGCCQVLDSLKHAATGSISGAELKPQVESYLRAFKATRQEMLQSFYFCLMLFFGHIYIYRQRLGRCWDLPLFSQLFSTCLHS